MEKKSTKSVRARILLAVLILLLAAALAVLYVNRENIKALYRGLTTDTGKIGELLEQNKEDTQNALSDVGINVSKEDFDKLNNGELSEEEIAAILYDSIGGSSDQNLDPDGETPSDVSGETDAVTENDSKNDSQTNSSSNADSGTNSTHGQSDTAGGKQPSGQKDSSNSATTGNKGSGSSQTTKPSGNQTAKPDASQNGSSQPVTSTLSEEEYNKKVADLVAKMYVVKANFTSTLSAFEANIISSYKSLPAEQRTSATKAKIVSDNMSYVTGLEAQCDAQVKAITDELSALMKANGKDTSLVDAINSAYANEKELKKAYYISLYK